MPFVAARDCNGLEYDAFMSVFSFLKFDLIGTLSLVCKRWRSAAGDPYWKPDVVVYAWGSPQTSGLAERAKVPQLLDFSLRETVVSLCCAQRW